MARNSKSVATSDDDRVFAMIERVQAKKKEIAELDKPSYKTNMSFSPSNNLKVDDKVNLHTVSSVSTLLYILGAISNAHAAHIALQRETMIKPYPDFVWQEKSYQDWMHDITIRINKLQIDQRRTELQQMEQQLESVITPEQKRKMLLDKIENKLG